MGKPTRLSLQLDFSSGLPAYLQIVQRLERQASSGRLHAGDQLPTVRALADELGLNFNTVARAYRLLHRTGVVSAQRGRGTYVTENAATSTGGLGRESKGPGRVRAGGARRQRLAALTEQFIEVARAYKYADSEIAAMIKKRLHTAAPRP
jgi:GntR family transcriptional regulator